MRTADDAKVSNFTVVPVEEATETSVDEVSDTDAEEISVEATNE
jgi:hypothetical protein